MKNVIRKHNKGLRRAKTVLSDSPIKRSRGARHSQTQTVYIKLPLSIVDFIYDKYPDMTIAGGVEKLLAEFANGQP